MLMAGNGFLANMASKLPFGMSNVNNNTKYFPADSAANPNFPSKNQLDPKNTTLDPNNCKCQC
jgi:hypothetical protein